jgi:hypothetical protein
MKYKSSPPSGYLTSGALANSTDVIRRAVARIKVWAGLKLEKAARTSYKWVDETSRCVSEASLDLSHFDYCKTKK